MNRFMKNGVPFALLALLFFAPAVSWGQSMALIQYSGDRHFGDKQTNRNELSRMVQQSAARGARIVVLPEGAITGYETEQAIWALHPEQNDAQTHRDVADVAEAVPDGPTTQHFLKLAVEERVTIVFNLIEKSGSNYHNSLVAVSPNGDVQVYRKRKLWHTDRHYATPGDSSLVLETEFGKFGLLVCYDAFTNELYEEYKSQGVENIIVSMHWPTNVIVKSHHWIRSRADRLNLNVFVADDSQSNGTGFYSKDGQVVQDFELSGPAEGDRVVLVDLTGTDQL